MSEEIINVMIVDDISSLCTRYEGILSQAEDIRVVAVANNGYEAILKSAVTQPDVILMDIEMESKYAGITATQQILAQFPDMKVVILTVYDEDAMIYAAFQAGACDYIQKTATPAMMLQCVRETYYDRSVMKPTVARKIRTAFKRIKDNEDSLIYTLYLVQLLTDTERDILYAFHSGMTQKEICQARYIEPSTMKTHMRNILHKMKCRKMEDVLKKAESCGFFYYMDKIREKQQQG